MLRSDEKNSHVDIEISSLLSLGFIKAQPLVDKSLGNGSDDVWCTLNSRQTLCAQRTPQHLIKMIYTLLNIYGFSMAPITVWK